MTDKLHHLDTRLASFGRGDASGEGYVNLPVHHASSYIYSSVVDFKQAQLETHNYGAEKYARMGTEAVLALEKAIAELEHGYAARATSSGLSAITTALLAFAQPGKSILIPKGVYPATQVFCENFLSQELGIGVTFYDPRQTDQLVPLLEAGTSVLYLESPTSNTFEVQDIPALTEIARSRGVTTIADNTWSASILSQPIRLGVDVSVSSLSKYVCGHADALLGMIVANEPCFERIRIMARLLGQNPSPDAVFLALRGLRTLSIRLERHKENALALAGWLVDKPSISEVYCPGLPNSLDNALWKRDFSGHSGLFSVRFKDEIPTTRVDQFIDDLRLFRLGSSWGGFESLIIPVDHDSFASGHSARDGVFCRIHAGTEHSQDLIDDLDRCFSKHF